MSQARRGESRANNVSRAERKRRSHQKRIIIWETRASARREVRTPEMGELREAARSVPECGNDDECVVEEVENRVLPLLAGALGLAAVGGLAYSSAAGVGLGQLSDALATIDVKQFLEDMVGIVERSGPLG